jgi:DNA-binding CsgD family transcriptional regulator
VEPVLVEREDELARLRHILTAAREGRGGLAFVEGAAGEGKTRLLRALRAEAEATDGMTILTAAATELERDFAFGVVRQLFEPYLRRLERGARERAFVGAAGAAAGVFAAGLDVDEASDVSHVRLHGLSWLCANLSDDRPLLLIVDDAHWADAPSLRFLHMIARRLEDLPVMLAVGARPHEAGAQQDLLDALSISPATSTVPVAALGVAGVRSIVERALDATPDEAFVDACVQATAGNPLLVTELVRALAARGFTGAQAEADAARVVVPSTVARIVRARLRRLAPDALTTARGISILGERSTIRRVSAVTASDPTAVRHGVTALVEADLLEAGALRFIHPLVREAVATDVPAGERSAWHRAAARALREDGADPQEVAVHLLATEPEADPDVVASMLAAGRRALADGAAEIALRLLRRAAAEPPREDERPTVLLALGEAEAMLGDPAATEHLLVAAQTGDADVAARAALVGAPLLSVRDRPAVGAELLARVRARLDGRGHPLEARLEDASLQILPYHEPLLEEYEQRLAAAGPDARPALLSHLAHTRALRGAPAAEVRELAGQALRSGALIRESGDRIAYLHAFAALLIVEAAEDLSVALEEAARHARRSGSRVTLGSIGYVRSTWEQQFGDLRRAVDEAREAMELLAAAGADAALIPARIALVAALLDRGDVDAAHGVAAEHPPADRVTGFHRMHGVRARLRLVQGRPAEALAELEALFALESARGWTVSHREATRATFARALQAVGRSDEALAVSEREVMHTRARGVAGAEARILLARAAALPESQRTEVLREADTAARRSPSRLVQAESALARGIELRRAGHRTDARGPLREAQHLASLAGAAVLEQRAHDELVIAGARPQRVALAGIDALTAAERRVAELAAEGLRNRDIAETLFVSLKTVESHLGHIYSKLDIRGRSQLAEALRG